MGVGPVGFGVEQQDLIWVMWRRGDAIREMERTLGETMPRIRRFLRQLGGIPPVPRQRMRSKRPPVLWSFCVGRVADKLAIHPVDQGRRIKPRRHHLHCRRPRKTAQ